ncbi:MAG: amino acid permease, partial [Notoacmeibacter sp.]
PPNDSVFMIVIGFLVLAVVLWFALENRRFQGPPIGDEIKKRAAAIAAAEKAVGQTS